MNITDFSTLDHVVIDFSKRKIELIGEDGEYKSIECAWNKQGSREFKNMVEFCQNNLPNDMKRFVV